LSSLLHNSTDEEDGTKAPPPKKARGQEVTITTTSEDTSYQEEVKELEEECKKGKPRRKKLRELMQATYIGRRDWIIHDIPTVDYIVEIFPLMKKPTHVSCLSFGITPTRG